jgi:glycosyltransferase involved in cell wall biosynthesis
MKKGKVVFATPSIGGPTAPYIKSLEDSIPLITEAGWEEGYVQEIGNPYISAARATMTRKALDAKADVIIYIDYDLSWEPKDLLTLLETEGDVVAGTYRFKKEPEEYMGNLYVDEDGLPIVRESDGAIKSKHCPAGFLKVTKGALIHFAKSYPELVYGDPLSPSIDLFNHGARDGVWWGEDYAFCDRWIKAGGEVWTPPNINVNHHSTDYTRESKAEFKGNLHEFLLKQPGGINHQEE